MAICLLLISKLFQSTPPGWRATRMSAQIEGNMSSFNPRPPGGGRRAQALPTQTLTSFNPRPPGGGRRYGVVYHIVGDPVSIHAPRVEGDRRQTRNEQKISSFNPRPPGGGRRRIGYQVQ